MSVKSFFAAMTLKAKIIIVCTAVAVTSAAAVAVGVAVTKEDAYRVLKVFEMTGTAVVERDGSGALDAYVGMNLESGDTLTVADDSTLRISMDSDKYVLLDGGTILDLVATGSPSDSRTSIDLKKGTILNEITNPLSANSSYEVSTPKATMAVRGTSFTVSVIDDDIGGYIIREDTFNGTVEVTLLDTDGKPKNDTALVPADKGVTIRTEPDKESGNPAEIDGFSRFVFENEEGIISDLGAGENPIRDIRYDMVSATIKRNALRSNDENLMELDEEIVAKLRETSTTAAQTEKTTAAVSEPAPIASVSETAPVQTSVPEISAITEENTQTADPSATIENQYSSPETSDVSLSVTEADLVSETAPTSVNSDTETVSEAVTAETTIETTAETTVETIAEELFESEPETVAASSETKAETSETVSNTTTRYETTVATFTTQDLIYNGSSNGSSPSVTTNGSSPSVTTGASAAEKSVFEVKFMYDETLVSSVSVEGGKPVSNIPSIPEKNGYTGKWICDGKEFTSVTAVTSDITVNAVYTINTYAVTLTAAANETYSNTVTADYGTLLSDILPEVPAKTGYTGVWKIGGTVDISSSVKVTSDLDIRAVYTANTYTVTFTAEADENYSSTVTADYGTPLAAILPEVPAKTGYTGEWKIGGTVNISSGITVTADLDIKAVYTINTYTITLTAAANETYSNTVTAVHGTLLTDILPEVPTKTGYTGVWKIKGTVDISSSVKVTSDLDIRAVYTVNTYTVTFTAEADENYSSTVTADHGTPLADILPEVPAKTGYTGVWKIGGTVNISGGITVTADLDIQAVYAINTYTVTFKAEGSEDITKTAVHGTTVTEIPSVPEKTGYTGKW
ncbi:MAG: FecR domain-containing protein, partial [Oscillospiraceae bacterium]|nr:FecR domain-containing protein [Oscillospiraceae bacterium]MDY6208455.1 FecR domain-containing protein [Oscillospiraceae bacterium]